MMRRRVLAAEPLESRTVLSAPNGMAASLELSPSPPLDPPSSAAAWVASVRPAAVADAGPLAAPLLTTHEPLFVVERWAASPVATLPRLEVALRPSQDARSFLGPHPEHSGASLLESIVVKPELNASPLLPFEFDGENSSSGESAQVRPGVSLEAIDLLGRSRPAPPAFIELAPPPELRPIQIAPGEVRGDRDSRSERPSASDLIDISVNGAGNQTSNTDRFFASFAERSIKILSERPATARAVQNLHASSDESDALSLGGDAPQDIPAESATSRLAPGSTNAKQEGLALDLLVRPGSPAALQVMRDQLIRSSESESESLLLKQPTHGLIPVYAGVRWISGTNSRFPAFAVISPTQDGAFVEAELEIEQWSRPTSLRTLATGQSWAGVTEKQPSGPQVRVRSARNESHAGSIEGLSSALRFLPLVANSLKSERLMVTAETAPADQDPGGMIELFAGYEDQPRVQWSAAEQARSPQTAASVDSIAGGRVRLHAGIDLFQVVEVAVPLDEEASDPVAEIPAPLHQSQPDGILPVVPVSADKLPPPHAEEPGSLHTASVPTLLLLSSLVFEHQVRKSRARSKAADEARGIAGGSIPRP